MLAFPRAASALVAIAATVGAVAACGTLLGVGELEKVDCVGCDGGAGPGADAETTSDATVNADATEDGGPGCASGTERCGGACFDLARDPAHCGACDKVCGAGETCESRACSRTFYIAPNGVDSPTGGTVAAPWKTFAFAIPRLLPGATLVLRDGEYTLATTGLPSIDCSAGVAKNGLVASPITVRAENERRAVLVSDGTAAAFQLLSCSFWNVHGLVGKNADRALSSGGRSLPVFDFYRSTAFTARRLVAAYTNRYFEREAFAVSECTGGLVEETEVYSFHRFGLFVYGSSDVVIRRVYANSRDYADLPARATNDPTRGDNGIIVGNGAKHAIVENCIAEDSNESFYAGMNPNDGTPQQFLGCIAMDASTGFGSYDPSANVTYKDVVAVRATIDGMFLNNLTNARVTNATIFAGGDGIYMTDTFQNPTASVFLTNVLSFANSATGIRADGQHPVVVEHSNSFANGSQYLPSEPLGDDLGRFQRSLSTAVTGVGLTQGQCIVYVPAGSTMKGAGKGGADIGANIVFRYENGALTSRKLWDEATGRFPCGVTVPGLTDIPGTSCFDVHARLNVGTNGCAIP